MRRFALALLAAAAAAGVAGAAAPARSGSQTMVIRVVSYNRIVGLVDKAPKGKVGAGDRITSTSTLRNQVPQFGKPQGALVGRDRATYRFESATAFVLDGYATLPGGRIFFHGRVTRSGGSVVPVTGGTGRYANARGRITGDDVGGNRSINVYRLTLP